MATYLLSEETAQKLKDLIRDKPANKALAGGGSGYNPAVPTWLLCEVGEITEAPFYSGHGVLYDADTDDFTVQEADLVLRDANGQSLTPGDHVWAECVGALDDGTPIYMPSVRPASSVAPVKRNVSSSSSSSSSGIPSDEFGGKVYELDHVTIVGDCIVMPAPGLPNPKQGKFYMGLFWENDADSGLPKYWVYPAMVEIGLNTASEAFVTSVECVKQEDDTYILIVTYDNALTTITPVTDVI